MAAVKTQPVVSDLGSQVVAQHVVSYNALLDAVGTMITALKAAADPVVVNAATAAEASLELAVKKIEPTPNIPLAPAADAR